MEIKNTLEQLGLTGKKADIYLAALELGSAPTTDIAKKAGIKRTTCYDIILDLKKEGLIFQTIKGKRRFFIAENPEKMLKKMKEKEKIFSEILPQLKSIYNVTGRKPKISFYEGKQGLIEMIDDTLKYKGPIYAFASEEIVQILGKQWAESYWKKRRTRNISVFGILPRTEFNLKEIVAKNIRDLRTTKLIDLKKYPFSIEIDIYANQKVALLSSKEEIGLIIEGKEIYNTMKSIFDLIWDLLPEAS